MRTPEELPSLQEVVGAMGTPGAQGAVVLAASIPFNAVKVFSATMAMQRERLGEVVTDWIARHPAVRIIEMVVSQSSDAEFHCISITLFYRG